MKSKIAQFILVLTVGAGTFFVGSTVYRYFTHNEKPHLFVEGLVHEQYCKGELLCSIVSKNNYKIANVQAYLDEQPISLNNDINIRTKNLKMPLSIDTTALSDGKHTLVIEATDNSYHQNNNKKSWDFYVDNVPLKAAFLDDNYSIFQGKTLHLKIKTNKPLKIPLCHF